MIARKIVDSDLFLGMPTTTQNLYFHLSVRADDDGFINNVKSIMAMVKANDDDLRLLITRQYVIPFESGIIVITHWRVNNYLRKGRCTETQYVTEKSQLVVVDNKPYRLKTAADQTVEQLPLPGQENSTTSRSSRQTPTLDEIKTYCAERNNHIDAEYFFNYYQSRKWRCGKTKITDWQGLIRQWEQNQKKHTKQDQGDVIDYDQDF